MSNKNLNRAKKAKDDEYYTRLESVEREIKYYNDQFKDKVIYCNCDNPSKSWFVWHLRQKYEDYGFKKLIATCITEDGSNGQAYIWDKDINGNGILDDFETDIFPLKGNGDFRSPECIEFLKEADIVITNPPFSLFREYMKLLLDYNKEFLVIGNWLQLCSHEIFPHVRDGRIRTGHTFPGDFVRPDGALGGPHTCWYTNLKTHKASYPDLLLREFNPSGLHLKYDNYDVYNCDKLADIPYDTYEVIGVPFTILEKIADDNYAHFEHVGMDGKTEHIKFKVVGVDENTSRGYSNGLFTGEGTVCPLMNGKGKFTRVFIQRVKDNV